MTRTQKLGLCTWLPEDPVSLAEMNDNFSRLDANGGRSLLLAEAGMRTLGGVMAALAHQGGHAVYAERVQVDAFQDAEQIAANSGVYQRGNKQLELLTTGLEGGDVYYNANISKPNDYCHTSNLNRTHTTTQEWVKLFDFYPDAFGQLTHLKFQTASTAVIKLRILDSESGAVIMETDAVSGSKSNYPEFSVDCCLSPNHRYAMYLWVESRTTTSVELKTLTFTVTPLVYTTAAVTMSPLTLPAGAARLELLVHDAGAASSAALKFDSGEFAALTQLSAKPDRIPGGAAATLRRYTADIPTSAQTAQLKLTLNGSDCKLYDYALIAM